MSGKQKGSVTKFFVSVLCDKKLRQNRYATPPPMHENFRKKKFSETPKCSPMNFFGTVRQKLRRKIVMPSPLLSIKFFPYEKVSETQNGSLAKFFRSFEIKKNQQNREALPSFV